MISKNSYPFSNKYGRYFLASEAEDEYDQIPPEEGEEIPPEDMEGNPPVDDVPPEGELPSYEQQPEIPANLKIIDIKPRKYNFFDIPEDAIDDSLNTPIEPPLDDEGNPIEDPNMLLFDGENPPEGMDPNDPNYIPPEDMNPEELPPEEGQGIQGDIPPENPEDIPPMEEPPIDQPDMNPEGIPTEQPPMDQPIQSPEQPVTPEVQQDITQQEQPQMDMNTPPQEGDFTQNPSPVNQTTNPDGSPMMNQADPNGMLNQAPIQQEGTPQEQPPMGQPIQNTDMQNPDMGATGMNPMNPTGIPPETSPMAPPVDANGVPLDTGADVPPVDAPVIDDDGTTADFAPAEDMTQGADDMGQGVEGDAPLDGAAPEDTGTAGQPGPGLEYDSTRKYTLFKNFMSLSNAIDNYINKLEVKMGNDADETTLLKSATDKLREINDLCYDYITLKFEISTYVQSLLFFQKLVVMIQMVFDMINNGQKSLKKREPQKKQ